MKELLRALQADRDEPTFETQVVLNWNTSAPRDQRGVADGNSMRAESQSPSHPTSNQLHPDARANFDAKAEALLGNLISSPAEVAQSSMSAPNVEQIATRLPDHAVPGKVDVFRNGEGVTVARCFVHGGMITGLQGEGYRDLRRLAEAMQRTPALRMIVGINTLEQFIFEWIVFRITGSKLSPMCDNVINKVAAQVADFEVVLPLFRVELPESLQIGRVTVRTVSSADFARWEAAVMRQPERSRDSAQLRALFFQERKKMQGFAAVTMILRGVPDRVLEIAREESEAAVSSLRLFSPAILSPHARSFCTLWGRQNLESTSYLLFQAAQSGVIIGSHVDTPQNFVWRIDASRWRLIRQGAMDRLIEGLYEGGATAFRDEVKAALALYSQSALRSAPTEKLLAILIALESLLLRNQSEPITENIAVRLAFAVGETLEERKRIVEIVRAVYAMRSAYVHHLRQIKELEDLEKLREFMGYAWTFFLTVGTQASSYRERTDYLNSLDERKLA